MKEELGPHLDLEVSDRLEASDRLRGWLKKKWRKLKRRLERKYRKAWLPDGFSQIF